MKKGLRRVAAVAVAALVVAPALATAASATSTFAFDRLAGIDRYATSVATATQYGASTSVILANGDNRSFPDALTASYLAGEKNAPILLTKRDETPANVLARITASGATTVYLVGGEGVISAAQATALDATFGTVTRLGGLDRYLTAQAVIADAGVATSTTAILATGVNFPDAIAGGPLSYVKGMPLAITATNTLPAATLAALKTAGTTNVIVLGGPTIVTQAVLDTLAANGITLNQRIFGANRSETSSKLAEYMLTSQGFSNTAVNVASGYAFGGGADALGGGALSGKENRPTLITESVTNVGPGPLGFLTAHAATLASGHIFGGLGAVSQASEDAMETAARTAASNQTFTVTGGTSTVTPAFVSTYSVSGITGTTVDMALLVASDVTVAAGGQVTFKGSNPGGTGNHALQNLATAQFTVVNGSAFGPANIAYNTAVSTSGTVTFSVTSGALGTTYIPVVFADNGDNLLALNANSTPSELFGVGTKTSVVPPEAALGAFGPVTVGAVDLVGDSFSNSATYFYDSADVFQIQQSVSTTYTTVTMAAFEAALTPGDIVAAGSFYNDVVSGTSQFRLQDIAPDAPTSTATASTTGITVVIPSGGAAGAGAADVANYKIYRGAGIRSSIIGVDPVCPTLPSSVSGSPQAAPGSAYTLLTTLADKSFNGLTESAYSFIDNTVSIATAPNNIYCYAVSAVDGNGQIGFAVQSTGGTANVITATNTSTTAAVSFLSAAVVDATHVTVTYNVNVSPASVVATPTVTGSDFTVVFTNGTVSTADVVTAESAAGAVVTLTLADAIPVGQSVIITSRLGSDGNTVADTNTPANFQAVGQAVQTSAFATVPGAPATATATSAAATTADVSWTAPVSNGGSAITGYTITFTATTAGAAHADVVVVAPTLTANVTGLTAGTYTITVFANNAVGTSATGTAVTGVVVA